MDHEDAVVYVDRNETDAVSDDPMILKPPVDDDDGGDNF